MNVLKATVWLFVVLVLIVAAADANAQEVPSENMRMDADGWVYEGENCDGNDWWFGSTKQVEYAVGGKVLFPEGWYYYIPDDTSYYYYESYGYVPAGVESTITYDYCEMEYRGAGASDYQRLYAHEEAHSRGLDHYELPADSNPAYEPLVLIHGF